MECFIIEDFKFKTTSEATVSIFAYVNKRASRIEIPSQVMKKLLFGLSSSPYEVTQIDDSVFRNHGELIEVIIPTSITKFGSSLFEGCSNLEKVVFPNVEEITKFGSSLFEGCSKLKKVVLPDNMEEISSSMFEGCSSLTEINIPQSVQEISFKAFAHCTSLTNVKIPDKVTRIYSYAFEGCTNLEEVILPASLQEVGENIFEGCEQLLMQSGDLLLSKDGKICFGLAVDDDHCPSNIVVPDSVLFIAESAFQGCEKITKVTLPNQLISIGDDAFRYCSNLTKINIPQGLTIIGCYAFNSCSKLHDIVLPDTLTTIGEDAFVGCHSFTKMRIPDSVTYLGYIALDECFARWEVIVFENHPCMEDLECLDDRLVIIGNDEDAEETDEETDEETILLEKCEQGDAEAMDELGFYYWIEDNDAEKALYWYQKSAALKYPQGMIDLGRCYIGAYDTSQCDYEKAITLFTEAAHLGCADGYYGLGVCYAEGLGVEKDRKKARELLLKAVEMGSEDAECYLDEEYDEE